MPRRIIWTHNIYLSKDVRIRGYSSKPEEICKQKCSGNTALSSSDSAFILTKHMYFFFPFRARAKTFILFQKASRPALGSSQPPVQRLPGALLSRKDSDWNVKLTTHLHVMPRLRMRAAIQSLPYIPLHGMHGGTFTFQQCFWRVLDGSQNKSARYCHHF